MLNIVISLALLISACVFFAWTLLKDRLKYLGLFTAIICAMLFLGAVKAYIEIPFFMAEQLAEKIMSGF